MRIEKVTVKGLFGLYDHEIPLNLDERVTILHGPNGTGKTTVLKMVDDLVTLDLGIFFRVPFGSFLLTLDEGEVEVSPQRSGRVGLGDVEVSWRRAQDEGSFRVGPQGPLDEHTDDPFEAGPWLRLRQGDLGIERVRWFGCGCGNSWNVFNDRVEEWGAEDRKALNTAANFYFSMGRTAFITDQRLTRFVPLHRKEPMDSSVEEWPVEDVKPDVAAVFGCAMGLGRLIAATIQEYGAQAQRLDQTFPDRIIKGENPSLQREDVQKVAIEIEIRQRRLRDLGLLPMKPLDPFNAGSLDSDRLAMLAMYFQDTRQKLDVFDGLVEGLGLFQSIIAQKFQNKRVVFSDKRGFVFKDPSQKEIPLDALSSGEQHEVVMLSHMLFRVPTGTLVLIDEPEMSLHVAWQRDALRDLLAIAHLRKFDVLLATHSPYIVADRWDLTVELSGKPRTEAVA